MTVSSAGARQNQYPSHEEVLDGSHINVIGEIFYFTGAWVTLLEVVSFLWKDLRRDLGGGRTLKETSPV